MALWRKNRWRVRYDILNKVKSVPCADCGGTFPPICMDFDHRNPVDKIRLNNRQLSSRGMSSVLKHSSLETLMSEIAKCDIVCANCHRLRTAVQQGSRIS